MIPELVRNETLITASVDVGLNRSSVNALPAVVDPPAKYHEVAICEAQGAVLHPPVPVTTWLAATPPPANTNDVATSPAVNPGAGLTAGDVATSFVFAGGGVAANQVVTGTGGWSTAPCASQIATSWYFAGGSTTAGNALTLDLFNPTSTDAVINVSFLTNSGIITPSAYQGLVVPAGQIVAENVEDFVQNQPEIATLVSAQSTAIVADEVQQWSTGPTGG